MTDPEQPAPAEPEQPPRPQPPAMTALEVARAGEPANRIMCPDGAPRCLWAAPFGAPFPDGDNPAETVAQAAGCRDEPRRCPCATAATEREELVAALAAGPLAAQAAAVHPMRGGVAQRGPTTTPPPPGAVPALTTLSGPIDLDPLPLDTPTIADRPIIALSGSQGLSMLAQVWAQDSGDGIVTVSQDKPAPSTE